MTQSNGALVTDFLAKNKVVISYIRNNFGFKKGLVIAFLLPNGDEEPRAKQLRLGWSLVNNNEDVVWKYLRPDQLPIVQRKELVAARLKPQEKKTEQLKRLEVKAGKAVDRLLRQKLQVKIPKFEKRLALYYAIDRALQGKGITAEQILAAKKYNAELRDYFLLRRKERATIPFPTKPDGDLPLDRDVLKALVETDRIARKKFKLDSPKP